MGKATSITMRSRHRGGLHITAERQAPSWTRTEVLNSLGPVLYAVATHDGLVKIGFTRSLASRSAQVGGMNAILAVRLAATMDDERNLHRSLVEHRARGHEYYHPADAVMAVVNDMRAAINMPPLAADDLAA